MKRILTAILIATFVLSAYAQSDEYKVIKVQGQILHKSRNDYLNTGDIFRDQDPLEFNEASRAAVINPDKGRLIITASNFSNLASASSNYLPAMSNIATRGVGINNSMDLRNSFEDNTVVLDNTVMVIGADDYKMDEKNFFYIRYFYDNEEINKKLEHRGDTLIINRDNLFTIDGDMVEVPEKQFVTLYFYKNDSESEMIKSFSAVMPDLEELKMEVQILLDTMNDKTRDEKMNEAAAYIKDFYGNINYESLEDWIAANFEL